MAVTLNASTSAGLVQSADLSGAINIQSNGTTVLGVISTGIAVTGTQSVSGAQSVSGNLSFNSGYGSSAVAYGCRAWVNFNGTGVVAIRASGNVSSITDNGTGDYTVNFTTAMPDVNYSIAGSSTPETSLGGQGYRWLGIGSSANSDSSILTTSVRVQTIYDSSSKTDGTVVCVAIFR